MTNNELSAARCPATLSWRLRAGRRRRDRVVGQATGILTVHHQCSVDDALRWLMSASQNSGQKVHLIAQEIVDAQNAVGRGNRSFHPSGPHPTRSTGHRSLRATGRARIGAQLVVDGDGDN
jgi:ANTAR domain